MESLTPEILPIAMMAEWATLGGVYWVCLIVAGGLLVLSILSGGDSDSSSADLDVDADFDLDADIDVSADVHLGVAEAGTGHGLELSDWLSLRFVIYFAASFGLVGTTLTRFSDLSAPVVLVAAALIGLAVGQLVHQTMRFIKRNASNSSTNLQDYVNKPARVTVAIRPPKRGEVAIQIGEQERFLHAAARRPDDKFETGAEVGVVDYRNGTVVVVSRKEFEFMRDSQ